ncbi:MAG: methyltransferase domain-containing protein [Patescibacteria group bacterium]|nr:methyltransferase domain-containing protein [Patescibacteria group bacterium]MBU1953089.1 methyltransferase domain-containing protein [Patescibacteria group bacterium]
MSVFDSLKYPKVIYEVDSKLNGKIRVIEVGKTRKLIANNVLQSINETSPSCPKIFSGKAAALILREAPNAKRILMLGLGGGTVASILSKKLLEAQIVSVEFDPVMVDVAKKYFGLDSINNHRVIEADALRVVVEPEEFDLAQGSFDVLFVDIFVGDQYPDLGRTGNFIAALKRLVTPGGLIVFNRIYTEEHQEDVNNFVNQVEEFLGDTKSEVVAGYTNSDNILVYGRV